MSEPIIEQLAEAILAHVAAVQVDAGYHYSLKPVRPTPEFYAGEVKDDLTVIVEQDGDPARLETELDDGTTYVQNWDIVTFLVDSESSRQVISTRANRIWADLVKRLGTDRKLGGLADLVRYLGPALVYHNRYKATLVIATVEVQYTTKDTDPYTAA